MTGAVTPASPPAQATSYMMDGVVLRTPLLPVSKFLDLVAGLPTHEWDTREAFTAGAQIIRERVKSLVATPEIAEALFIASPALVDGVPGWLDEPLSQRGQKVERSLVKYLARMSSRPTPFGLFSGCSTGRQGETTILSLESLARIERHSRLDMDYLFALTESLNRSPAFRGRLRFRPNDTLVSLGDRYRYVEPRVGSGNTRRYHLVAVEKTPYLDVVLEASREGASVDELVQRLIEYDADLTMEESRAYLDDLIDSHLLTSTLQPPVTGREPAGELAVQLRALSATPVAAILDSAIARLERLDEGGIGHPPAEYTAILELLKPLPAQVEISRLVQVDMSKPGAVTLGPSVRSEIERCADALARFGLVNDSLAAFRMAFDRRYGTATVRLLDVLDEESGIGMGDATPSDESPLIAGFPVAAARSDGQDAAWKPRHAWLFESLQTAWSSGAAEIMLTDEDMHRMFGSPSAAAVVDAFSVGFTLISSSAASIDRDDFLFELLGIGGPSGARVLGRFCHVDDGIAAIVREHLREEEAQVPDCVYAEIVHLPQARLGNVVLRPILRNYELTYLGRSGAPDAQQIPISDLMVSVRGNRVYLWSARLGKQVVPRLTNAHNYSQPGTLVPYRFLALLQSQNMRSVFSWDWGPLTNAVYLPRVRWGRCVLARASWRATAAELQPLAQLHGRERFAAARQWARDRRMPRLVELADGDNELLVDFDNPLSIEAFVELVDERARIRLVEMFPGPDDLCVSSPEGRLTHEIYVPVVRRRMTEPPAEPSLRPQTPSAVCRSFAPGGEWMFVKIYAGAAELDRVLTMGIAPVLAEARDARLIDRWFFVRFSDPEHHVRLRLRGNARGLYGDVLVRLREMLAPWLTHGTIARIQLDTYQPEVERYGGDVGLDLSEQVFHVDSDAVLDVLGQLEGDHGTEARWQLALGGLESLVDDFELTPEQKRDIIARRRREYGLEFNVDNTPARHLLGDRFRSYRQVLEQVWNRDRDVTSELWSAFAVWKRRSEGLRPLVEELRAAERQNRLTVPVTTLIESYLHMFVNRLSRAHARTHELVMFDFLERHLQSLEARARKGASSRTSKRARGVAAV
jgi:class I lanthipeptide synthase